MPRVSEANEWHIFVTSRTTGIYFFIQLVVINWLLGFVYDHFLNKNVYACGVLNISSRSRGHKNMPLVRFAHSCHIFMTSQTRGNI